ncbi:peptide chain release factor N(5)-glutamine methyltransferase [Rhodoferax sp. 4810]|uniref:Release factor glutamine methyltransferase n=1 Tax=Thiospirillum jenense TaxID=1653858 RepID=A0A839HAQ4_9GAMM|nr:peptide chain release factor N(5)-glutamine methyltransferase [Thiospirillum jenense]MBB1073372.1 peptide chain release factor N(5)-glutamine methyltransferase [Rhodoferax jenense]MBB1125724.1 peptide chain release factor N(5)-glutamine methyltransferase [Thiospirillum jenense]
MTNPCISNHTTPPFSHSPAATIGDVLIWAERQLLASPPDLVNYDRAAARLDAEVLLTYVIRSTRTTLFAWPQRSLIPDQCQQFANLIDRRCAGEPVAYLIGQREFWGIELTVSPATLIPRPDTELLVTWALNQFPIGAPCCCLDLGTGSGAIAIALATERPKWQMIALDNARAALKIAAGNSQRLQLNQVQFIQGDWLNSIAAQCCDLVVANPPYIAVNDPHLQCGEVRFEPQTALVAGQDGLAAIDCIIADLMRCLKPGGWVAIEHGWQQAAAVRQRFIHCGLINVASERDLAGIERITVGCRAVTV